LEKKSNGPRTDREAYSDLISKSKMSRNLAQKERALTKDETYELDGEFDEISDLLGKYKKKESDRQKEISEMIARMNASVQNTANTGIFEENSKLKR
jgi:hypothetical protein